MYVHNLDMTFNVCSEYSDWSKTPHETVMLALEARLQQLRANPDERAGAFGHVDSYLDPVVWANPTPSSAAAAKTHPGTSSLAIQQCTFVDCSDVCRVIVAEFPDFDRRDLFDELGNHVTWGNANRTLCAISVFTDAVKATELPNANALATRLADLIPPHTYIDLEN